MRSLKVATITAFALGQFVAVADAACGDRGGPGYRGPDGRCVGWADIGKTCGTPPTQRCAPEKVATGSSDAAEHGQKAWDAGAAARRDKGRSD
jgi:hypothetical protein